MRTAAFEYSAPHSLEAALQLLRQRGEDAKVMAGGMSLVPLMKLRFATPALLVDLSRVEGLDSLRAEPDGLHIGALVSHARLEADSEVAERFPLIASAAPQIADPIVRNRGTLAGSLAHADPAGDWGSVMLALGAAVVARSLAAERRIPVSELLEGTFTTSLRPDEVISEVVVPYPPGRSGGAYLKLERKVGDFATVGAAVQVELENGSVSRVGIGLTGVGPKNLLAAEAAQALVGASPSDAGFRTVAAQAAAVAQPSSDVRGSAQYKRHMVEVFVRRGLEQAVKQAQA